MGIILDTGFLYSLKMTEDENHKLARLLLKKLDWKKFGKIIVLSTVVNETTTLVNIRTKSNPSALDKIESLFWGNERFFEIYPVANDDYHNIFNILKKYSNPEKEKLLSFVDASIIYIAQMLNFKWVVSFDRHFDGILSRIYDINLL